MLNITSGRVPRPQKLVLYGVEGIGKTSLAAQTPDPLFIDTEGGTAHLDVRRLQKPSTWEELIALIREVAETSEVCQTLVLDTADWAEQMCIEHICSKYRQPGLESFGYGKGYAFLAEEFMRLLTVCDRVIQSGKNMVITAHAKMRKQELPDEQGAFDRWELKLSKQTAPLLKEWPDALLFLNFKTLVVATDSNSHKAQGGKRVIYTSHHPCWDAKNRHDLPEEMPLAFESIAPVFAAQRSRQPDQQAGMNSQPQSSTGRESMSALEERMRESQVSASELEAFVAAKGFFAPDTRIDQYPERFLQEWLLPNWTKIASAILSTSADNPF